MPLSFPEWHLAANRGIHLNIPRTTRKSGDSFIISLPRTGKAQQRLLDQAVRCYGVRNMRGRRGERAPIRSAEGVITAPRTPRGDARADLGALLDVAHCVAQLLLAAPRDQHAGVRGREVVRVGRAAPGHCFAVCAGFQMRF